MSTQSEKLSDWIKKTEKELADAKLKLEQIKSTPVDQQLATDLHSIFCVHNHMDVCGWYYEKDFSPSCRTKNEYLKRATKLIEACEELGITTDQALKLTAIARGCCALG